MHLAKFEKGVCLVSVNSCSNRASSNSKVELDETHGYSTRWRCGRVAATRARIARVTSISNSSEVGFVNFIEKSIY